MTLTPISQYVALLGAISLLQLSAWGQTPGNIEAAEYDPSQNRWFISNNTSLLETHDGGQSYNYFGSASATHGMEVMDGHLFAIGSNVIRSYDLNSADLIGSCSIAGAQFLNGMGARSGELIVSDFSASKLHRIDITDPANMTSEVLVANTGTTPNGVVIDEDNNRAIVVNWGGNAPVLAVDLTSGELTTVLANSGVGNCDGIDIDGSGRFYVSSWSPARITRFENDFSASEVMAQGAADGLVNPADISYALATDSLGVANSGNGTPSFHYFGMISDLPNEQAPLNEELDNIRWLDNQLLLHSNVAGTWGIEVYNVSGQLLHQTRLDLPAASVRVQPERLGWSAHLGEIWRIQSPSGRLHSVRPGPRRP